MIGHRIIHTYGVNGAHLRVCHGVEWHYYTTDHLGSIRSVVSGAGKVEQINHYYPYGSMFADAGRGAELQPLSFGGKELDAMYGLQWLDFGARYHSPQVASFTRPDPMAAKYPHLSPYLYCANDPVNNTDPTGMVIKYGECENNEYIKRQVKTLRNQSSTFNTFFTALEESETTYTVDFGETVKDQYGDYVPGQFDSSNDKITFLKADDKPYNPPSDCVIAEEFYHAYQEEFKERNRMVWNREFEAKMILNIMCNERPGIGMPGIKADNIYSDIAFREKDSELSMSNFISVYLKEGANFAYNNRNIPNYNVIVSRVPNTILYLMHLHLGQ